MIFLMMRQGASYLVVSVAKRRPFERIPRAALKLEEGDSSHINCSPPAIYHIQLHHSTLHKSRKVITNVLVELKVP